jgi:4'-phosphopantetheinyl transferase
MLLLVSGCAPPASDAPPCGVGVELVDLAVSDAAVARAESSLTPDEVARARRGTPAVQRRRVLLRAALRSALAAELGTAPQQVPLRTTPAGRPFVAASSGGRVLDVSCSASGALGVVAVGRAWRLGVDVETVAAWSPDVLDEGWLSWTERRDLARLPVAERPVAATRSWTQKEAVLKARGTGLHADPAGTVTAIGQQSGIVAGWEIRDVPVPDGWVASLALAPWKELPS